MIRIVKVMMIYAPVLIKKGQLYFLFKITAEAFGCKKPDFSKFSYHDALCEFARFTKEQAEKTIRESEDPEVIKSALFCKAFSLGAKTRKILGLSTPAEVLSLCRLLYKNIGIELDGNLPGEITIKSCYFSAFYDKRVCQFISAVDEGIITGLLGGGKLQFEQRLTEGSSCCRAIYYPEIMRVKTPSLRESEGGILKSERESTPTDCKMF
jgi:hypothetical protein